MQLFVVCLSLGGHELLAHLSFALSVRFPWLGVGDFGVAGIILAFTCQVCSAGLLWHAIEVEGYLAIG